MSYDRARQCIADMQRHASPQQDPINYDLGAALPNLADAIEADFRQVREDLFGLQKRLEALERGKR